MTPCVSLVRLLRAHPILSSSGWTLSAVASCALLVSGCSSESDETTEALPPVLIGAKVQVESTIAGVAVSGEPGAVTSSARVDVVNASTGQAVTTSADDDGSFELELGGTPMDQYRLYATLGEQSSRAVSIYGFTSDGEPGLARLEYSSVSADGFTLATDSTIHLVFDHGDLSFDAGCSTHSPHRTNLDRRHHHRR